MLSMTTARIHLARPGKYTDAHGRAVTLGADRLKALAASYKPGTDKAPLVLGHPTEGAPAFGWVDTLEVDDKGDLYGNVSQVSPELSDAVKAGKYRNVSMSFYPKGSGNSPAPAAEALRHVGILGAEVPAIRGLTPLSLADGDDAVTVDFADGGRIGWWSVKQAVRAFRDWIIERDGTEAADKAIPTYLIDNLDTAAREARDADETSPSFTDPQPETPMPPPEQKPVDLTARTAELDAREAELKKREAEIAASDAEAAGTTALAFADGLIGKGKLAPAGKETVVELHKRLAGDDAPLSLSDGGSKPMLAAFEALFEGAQPVIDLAERSKPDQSTDLKGDDPDALTVRANELVKANPALSFADAVREAEKEAAKE